MGGWPQGAGLRIRTQDSAPFQWPVHPLQRRKWLAGYPCRCAVGVGEAPLSSPASRTQLAQVDEAGAGKHPRVLQRIEEVAVFFPSLEIHNDQKWDRQQPQPPNLGPGPRTQWHPNIFQGHILPANLNFFPPRAPSPFLQGRPTRGHTRASASWPWPWPVGWGVSHRPGGAAAGDRHHTFARDRPRRVELNSGARAPPSSFCISLRPGMCQGERAVQFLSSLSPLFSLSSLFSNLCHICGSPPAPPEHTRFPGLLRLFALLLPVATRALPASVSHIHGPGSAFSGKRKYKSTKLPNWSPGGFLLFSLPLVTPRPEPTPLSEATDDDV